MTLIRSAIAGALLAWLPILAAPSFAQSLGPAAGSDAQAGGPEVQDLAEKLAQNAEGAAQDPAYGLTDSDLKARAMRGLMAAEGAASGVGELFRAIDEALAPTPATARPAVAKLPPVPTRPVLSAVVVELYTSQGCVNCPPADAFFAQLAALEGVIPLALHVDYWDYLGWQDPFAAPEYTQRQKAYARAQGSRTIYTPQLIVAGQAEIARPDMTSALEIVEAQKAQLGQVQIRLGKSAAGYRVELEAEPPLAREVVLQIVRYAPEMRVEILRGENAGREMDYINVVTSWAPIGAWDGRGLHEIDLPIAGGEPAVLIVQESVAGRKKPLPGPILAAVALQ